MCMRKNHQIDKKYNKKIIGAPTQNHIIFPFKKTKGKGMQENQDSLDTYWKVLYINLKSV